MEPRVSRSFILWTRTCRVSSIGIDPYVFIENLILAAAAVACVCLTFVRFVWLTSGDYHGCPLHAIFSMYVR